MVALSKFSAVAWGASSKAAEPSNRMTGWSPVGNVLVARTGPVGPNAMLANMSLSLSLESSIFVTGAVPVIPWSARIQSTRFGSEGRGSADARSANGELTLNTSAATTQLMYLIGILLDVKSDPI